MDNGAYLGYYYTQGLLLHVQQVDGELAAALGGTPPGVYIGLQPLGGDTFRMHGGPVDGLPCTFRREAAGAVTGVEGGGVWLPRLEPQQALRLPVVARRPAPPVTDTPGKSAVFAALLAQALAGDGGWLDYALPYPLHEFVQYASAQEAVIFHGSNDLDIETFVPLRRSSELRDRGGRGNRLAVYGTHDGLWAMFFAVMDRPRLRGSIRNGVAYFYNRQGERLALYNFSINQEQLAERPFCTGALYLLPRSAFTRLEFVPGAYSNEWACEQPVRPLAKLRVAPEDWPFLEVLDGHDDSQLIRMGEIGEALRKAATRAELAGETLEVWFPAAAVSRADLDEYLASLAELMPAVQSELLEDGEALLLRRSNLPPAVRATLAAEYTGILSSQAGSGS